MRRLAQREISLPLSSFRGWPLVSQNVLTFQPSDVSTFPSPLHEQNAITILRPVIHYFFHLQSRRAQLLDHNLLRNAVSAPVARNSFHRIQPRPRRKINNRQPPSALQRPH